LILTLLSYPVPVPAADATKDFAEVIAAHESIRNDLSRKESRTAGFTAFVPSGLDARTAAFLKTAASLPVATKFVKRHIFDGELPSSSLKNDQELKNQIGEAIKVTIGDDKKVLVGKSAVTKTDSRASNAVWHLIDKVCYDPRCPWTPYYDSF
jgi:uncharacterized surface protein with fasciclin (FAS1) repeats